MAENGRKNTLFTQGAEPCTPSPNSAAKWTPSCAGAPSSSPYTGLVLPSTNTATSGLHQNSWPEDQLPPDPHRLLKKLPRKDYLRRNFPPVNNYLRDCRRCRRFPHPNEILRYLIPQAVRIRGLIPKRPAPAAHY